MHPSSCNIPISPRVVVKIVVAFDQNYFMTKCVLLTKLPEVLVMTDTGDGD